MNSGEENSPSAPAEIRIRKPSFTSPAFLPTSYSGFPRFDLQKLKTPKITQVFHAKIGGKFAALCVLDSDVETLANSLKEVLLSTAEEVLGRHRKKIQP